MGSGAAVGGGGSSSSAGFGAEDGERGPAPLRGGTGMRAGRWGGELLPRLGGVQGGWLRG